MRDCRDHGRVRRERPRNDGAGVGAGIADRLALLHAGRFLVVDTPERVKQCADPVVQGFLQRRPVETEDSAEKFKKFLDEL